MKDGKYPIISFLILLLIVYSSISVFAKTTFLDSMKPFVSFESGGVIFGFERGGYDEIFASIHHISVPAFITMIALFIYFIVSSSFLIAIWHYSYTKISTDFLRLDRSLGVLSDTVDYFYPNRHNRRSSSDVR